MRLFGVPLEHAISFPVLCLSSSNLRDVVGSRASNRRDGVSSRASL